MILSKLPLGGFSDSKFKLQKAEELKSKAFDLKASKVVPKEMQQKLREVLVWHADIMKDIMKTIQNIPGLEQLVEEFTNAMTSCKCPPVVSAVYLIPVWSIDVYLMLEPWMKVRFAPLSTASVTILTTSTDSAHPPTSYWSLARR